MKSEQGAKQTVEIEILNQKYRIKSDTDAEWVKEVAAFVNKKIQDVITSKATVNQEKAAVLAALNIAGELLKLKEETTLYKKHVSKRSQDLMKLLDANL
ncbi:MAG: hypothetical protein A3F16_05995 [Deltaproteobacteria bacterium RIFCSPHIGHO2_12_FULL_43_9]|nr:MAG: hypothetical protein A3F16_05995 [Deltaproteobacteria bacterium RIFCSPHIGHO2_12_FULL_43_9]